MSDDTSAAMRLVDHEGRTLLDLRRAGVRFEPTAISGGGGLGSYIAFRAAKGTTVGRLVVEPR
jgi:hypothetical protein